MKKINMLGLLSFFYLTTLCAGDMDAQKQVQQGNPLHCYQVLLYANQMKEFDNKMKEFDNKRREGRFGDARDGYTRLANNDSVLPSIRQQARELLAEMAAKKECWNGIPMQPGFYLEMADQNRAQGKSLEMADPNSAQGEYKVAAALYILATTYPKIYPASFTAAERLREMLQAQQITQEYIDKVSRNVVYDIDLLNSYLML